MRAKLIFVTGSRAGTSLELGSGTHTFGRHEDQTIRFSPDEILVSSAQCTIEARDGGYVLRDAGSRNGTWVNRRRIAEHRLEDGDLIEFGRRGPTAQFVIAAGSGLVKTLGADELAGIGTEQAADRPPRHDTLGFGRGVSTTREFVAFTYRRSKRARRWLLGLGAVGMLGLAGLLWSQARGRAALEHSLVTLGSALEAERRSRALLETDLTTIRAEYDSLLGQVEESRRQLERTTALDAGELARRLSGAVALVVYSWGFGERGGDRMLRYQVDAAGRRQMVTTPDGRQVPAFGFDGAGPVVALEGSATGFLVDSTGWIVTNKHVAEPWNYRDDVASLNSEPSLEPRFITLRAYFPPGGRVFDLAVRRVSNDRTIDVAVLKTREPLVGAPVIRLADAQSHPSPGEPLIYIGYPTGVHNLLFRVADTVRSGIVRAVGQAPLDLAAELSRRRLIQPLAISGAVSDTTAIEIIHTAPTTGGGSGGPLIGRAGTAIGMHYAAVRSPIAGDPFQTQRGVRAAHVWSLLPAGLRRPVLPSEALPPTRQPE